MVKSKQKKLKIMDQGMNLKAEKHGPNAHTSSNYEKIEYNRYNSHHSHKSENTQLPN